MEWPMAFLTEVITEPKLSVSFTILCCLKLIAIVQLMAAGFL